jgi:hypothetical protein
MSNCPVCQTKLNSEPMPASNITFGYDCESCGRFILSFETKRYLDYLLQINQLKKEEIIAAISHAIRKMQKKDDTYWPCIDNKLLDAILKNPLPSLPEQANNLIIWFAKNTSYGDHVFVQSVPFLSIIGAKTSDGLALVLKHLVDDQLLDGELASVMGDVGRGDFSLSYKGWQYYEQLERGAINSRKVFMAMEYGDKELDEIVEKYFKPAVTCTGFELYLLYEKPKAGLIDDRLRVEIRNSKFLIADLTHENNGAYWEAGYAEGLGKPVIYTCKKEKFDKEKSHFDTNHHLTIIWDYKEPEKAMEMLKATIRATLPDEAKLTDD